MLETCYNYITFNEEKGRQLKIGFATILWGPEIDDLEDALATIAEAGYRGVEFSQRIANLGEPDDLTMLLDKYQLTLIGLAGGSLKERMDFYHRLPPHSQPEYLVVYERHPQAEEAIKAGFPLALHPHIFKPQHRLDEVLSYLHEQPELNYIPDTAILSIAGDDAVQALQKTHQLGQQCRKNRIAAVHFKDWFPEYGRSVHRYARGFTELGDGNINLEAVLTELKKIDYDGWLIVEQDNTSTDPQTSAFASARWLSERGLMSKPSTAKSVRRPLQPTRSITSHPPEAEVRFLQTMLCAGTEYLNFCYKTIAEAFSELYPDRLVMVWMCSPAYNVMSLIDYKSPRKVQLKTYTLEFNKVLSGIAIERQSPTVFDVTLPQPAAQYGRLDLQFGYPDLIRELGLKKMIVLPLLNKVSPHHARLVVNIFPAEGDKTLTDEELLHLGEYAAIAADSALDELCSYAAASANIRAGKSKEVKDFLHLIVELVQEVIRCEGVSIFLVNDTRDKLEAATEQIEWNAPEHEQFYREGEGLTGGVWKMKEARIVPDATMDAANSRKSAEIISGYEHSGNFTRAYLFVPLIKYLSFARSNGNMLWGKQGLQGR